MLNKGISKQFQNERGVKKLDLEEILSSLDYPVAKRRQEIKDLIINNNSFVLVGETGSGKTTCLPLIFMSLKNELGLEGRMLVTQPRRLATVSVATRVSEMIKRPLGHEIGYTVRFDDKTSEGTEVNFMTDGILLRLIQSDPLMRGYSVVMIDEAHERSLNIDLSLGLIKEVNKRRSDSGLKPLKIAVASATLDQKKFSNYFQEGDSSENSISIEGRMFPVETHYEPSEPLDYFETAAKTVSKILKNSQSGNILIFMPGLEEIKKTILEIQMELEASGSLDLLEILELHSNITPENQDKIFKRSKKRKIIVSTNVAETSVTVPEIKYVIDSGLVKETEYESKTGIQTLELKRHAKSGLDQRKGRAGREGPGECYRLFTKESYESRPDYQKPEIVRSELSSVILTMLKIGIRDINGFDFIDSPSTEEVGSSLKKLKTLGAIDEQNRLTNIGEQMSSLGQEPALARMIVESIKLDCIEEVCTIAAFFGVKRVLNRPKGKEYEADQAHQKFKDPTSDFLTLLNIWEDYVYEGSNRSWSWASDNFINKSSLDEVSKVRAELLRILRRRKVSISNHLQEDREKVRERVVKAIASGLIGSLIEHSYQYFYSRLDGSQGGIHIHPSSSLFSSIISGGIIGSQEIIMSPQGKIYASKCQRIELAWIPEIAPQIVEHDRSEQPRFDSDTLDIKRNVHLRLTSGLGGRRLDSKIEIVSDPSGVEVLAEALTFWTVIEKLEFDEILKENVRKQQLLNSLRIRSGEYYGKITYNSPNNKELVDFYKQKFLSSGVYSIEGLRKAMSEGSNGLDLEFDITRFLSEENQQKILQNNPNNILINEKIHTITYGYSNSTHERVVDVSPEDLFSMVSNPTIPSGKPLKINVLYEGRYFTGEDVEEIKKKLNIAVSIALWGNFERTSGTPPTVQLTDAQIEEFISGDLKFPDKVSFGVNPLTKDTLFAFPGIDYSVVSGTTLPSFYFKFCKEKEEADKITNRSLTHLKEQRLKIAQEFEAEKLKEIVKRRIKELRESYQTIVSSYLSQTQDLDEYNQLRSDIYLLEYEVNSNPINAFDLMGNIELRLQELLRKISSKEDFIREVKTRVESMFSKCPLCGSSFERVCSGTYHNLERVVFDKNEYGYSIEAVTISTLGVETEEGLKLVARLKCSPEKNKYHRKGDIYLETGGEIEIHQRWKGEVGKIVYTDCSKIMTQEGVDRAKEDLYNLPLPEGIVKLCRSFEDTKLMLFSRRDEQSGMWVLLTRTGENDFSPLKGTLSKSTGNTPEDLIKSYLRNERTEVVQQALSDFRSNKAALEKQKHQANIVQTQSDREVVDLQSVAIPSEGVFGYALSKASSKKGAMQQTQNTRCGTDNTESTTARTSSIESEIKSFERKIEERKKELRSFQEESRRIAPNFTSGESEVIFTQIGNKLVAKFNTTGIENTSVAEIMEWPSLKLIRLEGNQLNGDCYVEIVGRKSEGNFFSNEYGVEGETYIVKLVEAPESDYLISQYQQKISNLKQKINS